MIRLHTMGGVRRLLVSYAVFPTLPALLAKAYSMALQEVSCELQSNNYGVFEPASQCEKLPRSVAVPGHIGSIWLILYHHTIFIQGWAYCQHFACKHGQESLVIY